MFQKYINAFLNSCVTGIGVLKWGITDDGIVKGVLLSKKDRDTIDRKLSERLGQMKPYVSADILEIVYENILDGQTIAQDLYVIEIIVKPWTSDILFSTSKGDVYIKTEGGKQTRRFTIRMKDIIRYLEDREKHPENYLTPPGLFTNSPTKSCRQSGQIDNFPEYRKFIEKELRDIKEVLTSAEAAEVMLSKSITERIKCKDLKVYKYRARNIITKQNLLDSYFNMLQSNRSCYREFHAIMLERYRMYQEQEKQLDEDCGDMQMMM